METQNEQLDKVLIESVKRLLARAENKRAFTVDRLKPRIFSAVQKYLLQDDPDTSANDISNFIDGMQADDLCLIFACENGDETAWSELVERFTPTVKSAARSASANEDAAQDLAQSIWAELYGLRIGKDGKPSGKLAYYSGRGSLAGWLRAVVGQLAVDTYRRHSRLVQAEEDNDLDRLAQDQSARETHVAVASHSPDPEQLITTRRAESDMQQALSTAIYELEAEDRLLVKLYYFDDLRLREAGAVLGVHEATASRRLTRIQTELKKRVTQVLLEERGWTKVEAERAFAEVAQQMDTNIEDLVKERV